MINLMLTGRAAANVFNGDIEFNKRGRKLVRGKNFTGSDAALLSFFFCSGAYCLVSCYYAARAPELAILSLPLPF